MTLYVWYPAADDICNAMLNEMQGVSEVQFYEYIINELQFEIRVAASWGKPKEKYEGVLINKWSKRVIRKKGVDAGLDFINKLKANRIARKRTLEIKW